MKLFIHTKTKMAHVARNNEIFGTYKLCAPGTQTRFSRNLELVEGTEDEVTCIRCKRALSNVVLRPSDFEN